MFGAAITVGGLIAFFSTGQVPSGEVGHRSLRLRAQLETLAANRPLAWLSASFLFINVGDAVFSGSLVYYLTRILHRSPALIGTLYPVSSIAGILVAPIWWRAANRFGKVRLCRLALALNALCCLLPLAIPASRYALLYGVMVLYGLSNTGARLLPNAMARDTTDLDEARTGERREGTLFGILVFVEQTGFALGGFVLSAFLALGANAGAAAPEPSRMAILLSFTVGAALLYGCGFAAVLRYRLPGPEVFEPPP